MAAVIYPATRVACAGIRTGAAAFAGTEAGMACKSLSARAISLGRRAFSSATAVQEVAEGRLTGEKVRNIKTTVPREGFIDGSAVCPGKSLNVNSRIH